MADIITYTGDITIIKQYNNRPLQATKYHNKGLPYLFRYLCQCLAGVDGVLANKPAFISVTGNDNNPVEQNAYVIVESQGSGADETYYAEVSATFTQSSFGAGGLTGDNVTLKMLSSAVDINNSRQAFAETQISNFTSLLAGESVTIVWRMSFQNPTTSTTPSTQSVTKVSRSRKTTTTKTKEVEVIANG